LGIEGTGGAYARAGEVELKFGCLGFGATLAVLTCIGIYLALPHPTYDQTRLETIKAEALALEAKHPIKPPAEWVDVPKGRWSPAIADLHPQFVTVYPGTVMIVEKVFFDDSWGYFIPRDGRKPAARSGDYSELIQGVYWFHYT
jgi:hypothetical protein